MAKNGWSNKLLIILLFFPLFLFRTAQAQVPLAHFKSVGFFTGFGLGIYPDGEYTPIFFSGEFDFAFHRQYKKDFFIWYLEPQVNLVSDNFAVNIEFGCNIGIGRIMKISPADYFYMKLGTGPHYISAHVFNEARGFIFSDNFSTGFYHRLTRENLFLNLQLRLRHISNADLKYPNGGINTINFLIGLSRIK